MGKQLFQSCRSTLFLFPRIIRTSNSSLCSVVCAQPLCQEILEMLIVDVTLLISPFLFCGHISVVIVTRYNVAYVNEAPKMACFTI